MATLNLQVGASSDDANENTGGAVSLTGNFCAVGNWYGWAHSGFRFTGVSGLSGSTITSTTLTFRSYGSYATSFTGNWYAEDTAAPTTFTTGTSDITDRTRTTATVTGNSGDFGSWTAGQDYSYPAAGPAINVTSLIQELADSHNPSAISLLYIYASGTGERTITSYDSNSALAAKLDITYTAGGGDGTMTAVVALTTDASSPASVWTGDATLTAVPALTSGLASSPPGEITATEAGTIVASVATADASAPVSVWTGDATLSAVTATTTGASSPASIISAAAIGDWIARDSTQFPLVRADLPSNALFYLQAVMTTTSAENTVKGRLYNVTDDTPVVGSEVTSAATSEEPSLSSAFGIPDPGVAKTYRFESGGVVGGDYTWHITRLLVDW